MFRSNFQHREWVEPNVCLESCCHFDITDELLKLAEREETSLAKQKGINNPSTQAINGRRDFVGSLAQNGVFAFVESLGVYIKTTSYFNPERFNDDGWDYQHRGIRVDIKGRLIGVDQEGNPKTTVRKYTPFWVNQKQHSQKKGKVDAYCFVLVDLEQKILHIVGVIPYSAMENGEARDGKWPSYNVRAYQLASFRKHIFAT